ncbi:sulfite exporter TauE/SafE family protein [Anaeromicrobium sediminis]|uniref:Probable membrane transporter protein n=1 Tax=Anaeromicrobium sediminis TaxID=1478221 RepID=A0A267MJE4_9FIRM|nr:sulfite exporter TauE/SafE family protein [Anaeromicrobium sediminis]PAB58985.1 permease [Anaeromicrobium sediminis]
MKKNILFRLILLGFFAGLVNGLFGSGGGTILVPGMFFLTDMGQHKSHATAISIILPLTILSTYIYMQNGDINWPIAIKIICGSVIGAYIGAKLLNHIPGKILRKSFALFMLIAAIRMVF